LKEGTVIEDKTTTEFTAIDERRGKRMFGKEKKDEKNRVNASDFKICF